MTSSKMDAVKPDTLAEGAGRVGGGREAGGRSEIKCGICSFSAFRVPAPLCVCAPLIVLTGKIRHFYFHGISVF